MSFQEEYSDYLEHYGVRGMRWGIRKNIASIIKGFGKTIGSTAKSGAKLIKNNVKQQKKAQQIRSLKEYLEEIKSEKLQDFIREERNYLKESGKDALIKDLGNSQKKWEAHRKSVIREESKRLKELMQEPLERQRKK